MAILSFQLSIYILSGLSHHYENQIEIQKSIPPRTFSALLHLPPSIIYVSLHYHFHHSHRLNFHPHHQHHTQPQHNTYTSPQNNQHQNIRHNHRQNSITTNRPVYAQIRRQHVQIRVAQRQNHTPQVQYPRAQRPRLAKHLPQLLLRRLVQPQVFTVRIPPRLE